jgi:hypothetical protein
MFPADDVSHIMSHQHHYDPYTMPFMMLRAGVPIPSHVLLWYDLFGVLGVLAPLPGAHAAVGSHGGG